MSAAVSFTGVSIRGSSRTGCGENCTAPVHSSPARVPSRSYGAVEAAPSSRPIRVRVRGFSGSIPSTQLETSCRFRVPRRQRQRQRRVRRDAAVVVIEMHGTAPQQHKPAYPLAVQEHVKVLCRSSHPCCRLFVVRLLAAPQCLHLTLLTPTLRLPATVRFVRVQTLTPTAGERPTASARRVWSHPLWLRK